MNVGIIAAILGAGLCMGFGSLSNGAGIGYVLTGALRGWVRQPKISPATFRMMLIGQAAASTPSIFALVISLVLIIKMTDPAIPTIAAWPQAAAFLATGLCLGMGSLGSGFGCGLVGSQAVEASARTPKQSGSILLYMLVGQAWSQTPNIFALIIGLFLMFGSFPGAGAEAIFDSGKLLAVGICMGAGAIGPAIGIGYVAGKFTRALADNPLHADQLRNTFFVGAAVAESTTIYAFVTALILLFR
ncbi:MAG: ATP synthase F0 subunit C [Planctomycetes bacterium]|nr:ATP synthase F0 subunit C [Planctomycetota bacterium]